MNFTLGALPSEITPPCFEVLLRKNMKVPKPSIRVGKTIRKDKFLVLNNEAREVVVSSDMEPGHLDLAYIGKRRLEEPTRKLEFVRTLLIDNYDSYTYNIYQELSIINGLPPIVIRNDEWTWEDMYHYLYEEHAFDNIVISPGPGSPTCAADIGICLKLLHECRDIPILGVCLGHQALGYVNGAQVIHASEPVHGRLSEIEHNGCRLFNNIPSGRNSGFKVVRYHSLVVDVESLPKELIPIAWTSSTKTLPFHGTQKSNGVSHAYQSPVYDKISVDSSSRKSKNGSSRPSCDSDMQRGEVLMGIMHSTRPHYGLQFHPESVATCHGRQIFKNFREITEDYWLRLRSSTIGKGKFYHTACMQVPQSNRLFRDIQLMNKLDESNYRTMRNIANPSRQSNHGKFLKLKWKKLERLASQVGGARNIFCELFGDHKANNTFWLDSSSIEKKRARFSFFGGKSGSLWKQVTFRLSDQSDMTFKGGGNLFIEDAQGSTSCTYLEDGFFEFLNKYFVSKIFGQRKRLRQEVTDVVVSS